MLGIDDLALVVRGGVKIFLRSIG